VLQCPDGFTAEYALDFLSSFPKLEKKGIRKAKRNKKKYILIFSLTLQA